MALIQKDYKRLLGYHAISQVGYMMLGIGTALPIGIVGGLFHMVNNAMYKSCLFFTAGAVEKEAGTTDIRQLGGLGRKMPWTAGFFLVAALSISGVPPFNGFLSKEMFFGSSIEVVHGNLASLGLFAWSFPLLAVAGSIFTFLYCMVIVFKVFYSGALSEETPRHPHEPGNLMLIPGIILVTGTVLLALFANPIAKILLLPATYAVTGIKSELNISFWHGFNLPLIMSVVVIACGVYLYRRIDRVVELLHKLPVILSGNRIYDWLIFRNAIVHGANNVTNFYMTGRLQNYVQFTCVSFILIVAAMMVFKGALVLDFSDVAPIEIFEVAWVVAIIIASFFVVGSKSRTVSVLSLGIVGYSVAFFFVLFRAPDLALTQLVVETVSIVLFFLALKYLPRNNAENAGSIPNKIFNLAISIAMGAAVTAVALIGHSNKLFDTIANFYVENAKTLGGGDNIVNVLLVDFRGLDTMGEITVISIAAIGVFILISLTVGEKNEAAGGSCKVGENK